MKHKRYRFILCVLVLLSTAIATSSSHAKDYLIELVLFETKSGKDLTAGGFHYPKVGKSLGLNSAEATQAGFVLIDEGLSLTENANAMASSSRYRVLRHMAWRQPGLDNDSAQAIRINLGEPITLFLPDDLEPYEDFIPASINPGVEQTREVSIYTVTGTIKIRLGRFLHMDTLLVFTDPETGQGFKLGGSRKMRSRELHYIDNPRFGILTRILPLDDELLAPATDDGDEATDQ